MESVRIAIIGSPFTPIFEFGDRLAKYHNLDFITLESSEDESYDYFGDNIEAKYIDVGDLMSGSASQQMTRDPSDWSKMKELGEIYVSSPSAGLSESEKFSLEGEHFCILSSEIPDKFLVEWSDVVILLSTSESHAVEWLNKRRKCPSCGAVYHMEERVPQRRGYCDRCGTHIFQMERDLPENVRKQYRLWGRELWEIETAMRSRGNYIKIDMDKYNNLDDVFPEADRILRKILKKPDTVDWNYSIS